jgi:DNA-binding GntR family transcriptional regulator
MDLTIGEHREIVKAIEARDAGKARLLMQDHVAQGAQRVEELLFGQSIFQKGT